jgi:phosphopantetheinyl transferase
VTVRRILAVLVDAREATPRFTPVHHDLAALLAQSDCLSAFERERCARMLQPGARDLRLAAHVLKRLALSEPLGRPPADIAFVEPADRPQLADASLHVSLSHSRDAVAVAYGHAALGVDIEAFGRSRDEAALARRYFHADEFDDAAYNSGFAWRWTAKEALKKAADIPLFDALARPMPAFAPAFEAHGARFDLVQIEEYACALARMT